MHSDILYSDSAYIILCSDSAYIVSFACQWYISEGTN